MKEIIEISPVCSSEVSPTGHITIAIDGPSGAGKSTAATLVSKRLGLTHIDTGAMYRAVALKVMEDGVDPDDHAALDRLAAGVLLESVPSDAGPRMCLDGRDVTAAIRSREVSALVARVAAVPGVRLCLTLLMREMAARGGVVMEGRDIGTTVLPTAPYKFYITADPAVRVRRRSAEYGVDNQSALDAVALEMSSRDRLDAARSHAPLCVAEDAVVIDSTDLSAEQVARQIVATVTGRD